MGLGARVVRLRGMVVIRARVRVRARARVRVRGENAPPSNFKTAFRRKRPGRDGDRARARASSGRMKVGFRFG